MVMTDSNRIRFLALAPVVFLAHVAEEAQGFLDWFNRHAEPDLSMDSFVAINAIGLFITVMMTVFCIRSRNLLSALILTAWLSFLMLANGTLHILASLIFNEYVPGTVTAGIFYLPYFIAASITIRRIFKVRPLAIVLASVIGAIPMFVQGASIFMMGRRILW